MGMPMPEGRVSHSRGCRCWVVPVSAHKKSGAAIARRGHGQDESAIWQAEPTAFIIVTREGRDVDHRNWGRWFDRHAGEGGMGRQELRVTRTEIQAESLSRPLRPAIVAMGHRNTRCRAKVRL
jgi:hypothetical protein